MTTNPQRRGMHDLAGDPDGLRSGLVPRAERSLAPREKEVDAIRTILGRKGLQTADAPRLGPERLPGEDDARLSYCERWLRPILYTLERKGILKPGQLAAKIAELKARQA